jgi:hypothetical protein
MFVFIFGNELDLKQKTSLYYTTDAVFFDVLYVDDVVTDAAAIKAVATDVEYN